MRTGGVWWAVAFMALAGMKKVDLIDQLLAELSQKPLWSNGNLPHRAVGEKAATADVFRKSFD